MVQFPKNYFEAEERSGYLVGETIKRVWASQIEMLQKLAEICEKYELKYFAFWGTLLGTVRHQGFIPWDDDLDVAMLGSDYEIFLEVVEAELPEEYMVVNAYTSDRHESHFTRIVNKRSVDVFGKNSEGYHGCPFIMGIDVFPLYYVPRNKQIAEEQKQILSYIKQMDDIIDYKSQHREMSVEEKQEYDLVIAQGLLDIQKLTGYQFVASRPLNSQLLMVFDQICRIATANESDYVANYPRYIVKGWHLFEKNLFEEIMQLPFENITINVPKEYDTILKKLYGNYMIPKNTNKMNEHRAIQSQAHALGEALEQIYFQKKNGDGTFCIKASDVFTKRLSDEEVKNLVSGDIGEKIFKVDEAGEEARKMVMLYYLSVENIILHSEHVIDKVKRVLETFRERTDVLLWWLPSMDAFEAEGCMSGFLPETLKRYKELVEEYKKENWGVYDDSGDIVRAIHLSDAYYGDEGLIAPVYKTTGKWMLIQNYEL